MILSVIKVKDQNLFLNSDDVNGNYIHNVPMIFEESEAKSILEYCDDKTWVMYTKDNTIDKSQLEIKNIEINYK